MYRKPKADRVTVLPDGQVIFKKDKQEVAKQRRKGEEGHRTYSMWKGPMSTPGETMRSPRGLVLRQ